MEMDLQVSVLSTPANSRVAAASVPPTPQSEGEILHLQADKSGSEREMREAAVPYYGGGAAASKEEMVMGVPYYGGGATAALPPQQAGYYVGQNPYQARMIAPNMVCGDPYPCSRPCSATPPPRSAASTVGNPASQSSEPSVDGHLTASCFKLGTNLTSFKLVRRRSNVFKLR